MDVELEEKVLMQELQILAKETMANFDRVELGPNRGRRVMAFAQAVACRDMMLYLQDLQENEEFSEFAAALAEIVEEEYARYQEACSGDDRELMWIKLANVRILTTLKRRLANPKRRQLIALGFEGPVAMH